MNGRVKTKLLELFVVISECLVLVTSQQCASPQYLELGKSGSVICSFQEGFYGVYWYNSTDYQQDLPIVYLSRSERGGTGYTTREFDIFPNGSLLIHNVSLAHDHVFTVTFLQSQRDPQVRTDVLVVVIVIPTIPAPIILSCGEVSSVQNCLVEVNETMTLKCSVKDSRPAVDLKWTRRTGDEDAEISFKSETFSEGIYYTSHITTEVTFSDSFFLTLFSCQANNPAGLLERTESFILLANANLNLADVHQTRKVFPRFSKLILACTERQVHAFVWKRVIPSRHVSENILYAVEVENTVVTTLNDEFSLGGTNSLILPRIDINDEGMYACISTDGTVENVALYSVSVMVQPVPSNPVIDGCSSDHNCALEVMRDGSLTCSVKGIRPEIQLAWSSLRDKDEDVIVFSNQRSNVRKIDNLFDISLTVTYTVKKVSEDKMAVKCYGVGSNAEYFQLMTTVDLFFKESTIVSKNGATFRHWWWIVPLTIVFVAIVIVTAILLLQRKGKQFATKQSVEAVSMIHELSCEDPVLPDKRTLLIQQLQQRYKDLYDGVPPVPYRADEVYCVDSVYIDSVIDHLVSKERGHKKWEKVDSYEELFINDEKKSTRRILHGEPGYGKSIICLKVAYDWCKSNKQNIDVLVLVHLKQLGGVNSIYTAIKRYILPKDTRLSEEDIANILRDCKSVLVILDGFDEYPDQDTDVVTDVNSIISRRMFQQFTVVITTRSSFTPTKYPPQTEIYRLRGFDDDTRKAYISATTGDSETATKVQTYLKEHPILQDLSQVPFLLACFVHMIQDGENIKTAKSVTEVFGKIVSCFHSNMRNKRIFDDIEKFESFETSHNDLDEITFDSLGKYKWRIVWPKDDIVKRVGPDFYKQYAQIGILIEEEGVDVAENLGSDKDVLQKKEVSFVHKLFCEWYAAHHLSRLSSLPDANMEELVTHLDPSTLQYVYRFACGLSIDSAKKLIEYLPKLKGGEKCATLCIQEQLGAVDDFMDTIRLICTHGIIISKHDSILLQRSLIALLKTAAKKKKDFEILTSEIRLSQFLRITIKSLCIYNSLKSVDPSAIMTSSGETVDAEFPIERLKINVTDRALLENEAIQLLKFSVKCGKLNYIKFGNCVPPEDIGRLDKELLGDLQKKKITVKWRLDFDAEFHTLNLETGTWEKDPPKDQKEGQPTPLTSDEYESLRKQHEKAIERETEEKCRNDVEKGREILRLAGAKK